MSRAGNSSAGFTLLETLIALALAGMLFAIAGAAYSSSVQENEPRNIAENFALRLTWARAQAIVRNQPVVVVIDTARRSHHVAGDDQIVHWPEHLSVDVLASAETTQNKTEARIVFYPDGTATGGELAFSTDTGERILVAIDWITGRTRIAECTVADGSCR